MSIISGFFDTFLGYVDRIDRLVFPGPSRILSGGFVLTPGWYVGADDVVDDGEPFEEKIGRLTAELHNQILKSHELDIVIESNLKEFNYGG